MVELLESNGFDEDDDDEENDPDLKNDPIFQTNLKVIFAHTISVVWPQTTILLDLPYSDTNSVNCSMRFAFCFFFFLITGIPYRLLPQLRIP